MKRLQVLTLAFGTILATRLGAKPPQSALTVLVADRAGIGEETIRKATYVAEQVLWAAGISTEFVSCQLMQSGPSFRIGCAPRIGVTIYLSIVSKPLADHKVRSASAALALAGRPGELGSYTYVYYDRVQQAARSGNCTEFRVLGHVVAREVGHLLGIQHSSQGIMRPNWNSRAIREMCVTHLLFNPDEVHTLQHNIRKGRTPADRPIKETSHAM